MLIYASWNLTHNFWLGRIKLNYFFMFDPQRRDILPSQTQGYPFSPSAVVNIPIQTNLTTAAWQEAEIVLWDSDWAGRSIDQFGLPMRGTHQDFQSLGGLLGAPNTYCGSGDFQNQPHWTAAPKPRPAVEQRGVWHFQGVPLVLGLEMALGCPWSGDVGEAWAWGPCLPFNTTPVFSIPLHPCHLSAGCICLLCFWLLNYPSWKLVWSGQTYA